MSSTIDDFGAQWTRYRSNDGYYASDAMLADIFGPLYDTANLEGLNVADLGSGTGRIVLMLLSGGAARVTAVEPSAAFEVLTENTKHAKDRVELVNAPADQLPDGPYDLIVSLGVIHHIPEPDSAIEHAYSCLRPGGTCLIWLYGKEGNEAYLSWVLPLRRVTRLMPDWMLTLLSHALAAVLSVYVALCRFLPLPMRRYMREIIGRYPWRHRILTIFDQLNPTYAKYYTEAEARVLLEKAGFKDVQLYHRHGYSWTVTGKK